MAKMYKGFNKDMTCRGFQFEEGKTYETDRAELCSSGFHACERPLDVLSYYVPADSEYHEVEMEDVSPETGDDSKRVAKKITIGAKLSIRNLVDAQIQYVKEYCTNENSVEDGKPAITGFRGTAVAGDYSAAAAGSYSAAAAGDSGAAAVGSYSAAAAGSYSAAAAGSYSAAAAGDSGAAAAGFYSVADAGFRGVAAAGFRGAASAGDSGAAMSRGSSSVGNNGLAVARGSNCKVKGGLGSILVIAEENDDDYDIASWVAVVVDGVEVKADTWYRIVDGQLMEVEND